MEFCGFLKRLVLRKVNMKKGQIYLIGLLAIGSHCTLSADAPTDSIEGLIATPNWFFSSPEGGAASTDDEKNGSSDDSNNEKEQQNRKPQPQPGNTNPQQNPPPSQGS